MSLRQAKPSLRLVAFAVALLSAFALVQGTASASPPWTPSGSLGEHQGESSSQGSSTGLGRIVGGNTTNNSKYPWQALLYIETSEGTFTCGGSLIHPLIVLTAAHCLVEESGAFKAGLQVFVLLGDTEKFEATEVHEAFQAWKHPGYKPEANEPAAFSNDLAFVTLPEPSSRPRVLIAGSSERALWTPGRTTYVSGWGAIAEDGEGSEILKEALVPIIDDGTCAGSGSYGARFAPSVMLCAGYMGGGTDSCQGDSGGPLQSPIDGGGFRLVGVVSWGDGCAQPNKPGVYSRIAADPLLQSIGAFIPFVEEEEDFPPEFRGINVIGSGARPLGCAAAEGAASQAAAAAAAAAAAVPPAQQAAGATTGPLRSATKAKKLAQKVFKKKKKKGSKAAKRKARKRLAKATTKLKKAKATANAANQRLAQVTSTAGSTSGAATTAATGKTAACG